MMRQAHVVFGFVSSHKGGQHTNGPDYGVVTGECELLGLRIEVQTFQRLNQHKARDLIISLIECAALEIDK